MVTAIPEYHGRCFCGAVELVVSGEPTTMGYCHCGYCRDWSATPITAFSLWPRMALRIVRGAEHVGTYTKTPGSLRQWCKLCGGHLYTDNPPYDVVDVFPAVVRDLPFVPTMHANYASRVLAVRDGLVKYEDWPQDFGGTGVTLAE